MDLKQLAEYWKEYKTLSEEERKMCKRGENCTLCIKLTLSDFMDWLYLKLHDNRES